MRVRFQYPHHRSQRRHRRCASCTRPAVALAACHERDGSRDEPSHSPRTRHALAACHESRELRIVARDDSRRFAKICLSTHSPRVTSHASYESGNLAIHRLGIMQPSDSSRRDEIPAARHTQPRILHAAAPTHIHCTSISIYHGPSWTIMDHRSIFYLSIYI
jgi:hypothetical protein